MKKVSLRNFQLKPTKYLKDLPLILTRYKKKVAVVTQFDSSGTSYDGARDIPPQVQITIKEEEIKLCKHGSQIGLCKHGCKK